MLLQAIREGIQHLTWASETFAYAEDWDEQQQRYLGLRAGDVGSVMLDNCSLVVTSDAAR